MKKSAPGLFLSSISNFPTKPDTQKKKVKEKTEGTDRGDDDV